MTSQRGEKTARAREKGAAEKPQKESPTIRPTGVTVTFNVSVPEGTSARNGVFLTGSFHAFSPNLADWDPKGIKMKKVGDNRWTATIMGTPEGPLEYKYTLGNWEKVERDDDCDERPNRTCTLNPSSSDVQVFEDTVENWTGFAPCK